MSIRKFRALMALALYALAFAVAVSHDSVARSAELSGLSYEGTTDRVAVIAFTLIASALFAWNAGEWLYHNRNR